MISSTLRQRLEKQICDAQLRLMLTYGKRKPEDDRRAWSQRALECIGEDISEIVSLILREASNAKCSDLHLVLSDSLRILGRVQGSLTEALQAPKDIGEVIAGRVKALAGLPLFAAEAPASGRLECLCNGTTILARATMVPIPYGQRIVLRMLDSGQVPEICGLGLSQKQLAALESILSRPGLILISGPAGSGKTTTMYSLIGHIASRALHVVTFEEPVERRLHGITQLAYGVGTGMSIHESFSSSLRLDPDVLVVGEIRDQAAAEIAVRAALTGRPTLATIHASDAIESVYRLHELGINMKLVSSSISGCINQRLVRSLCTHCRGQGCVLCSQSGYEDMTGLFEVLLPTAAMRHAMDEGLSLADLRQIRSRAPFPSLSQEAMDRIKSGTTTAHEISRLMIREL